MGRGRDFREPRKRGFDEGSSPERWPEQPPQSSGGGGGGFDRGPPSRSGPPGPEQEATVKWFNKDKGFGFVELGDGSGDAFLHIRAVEAAGYSDLPPGSRLVIRSAQGQKGPQVTDVVSVDTSTAEAAPPRRDPRPPRAPGGYQGGGGGGYQGGGGSGGYQGGGGGGGYQGGGGGGYQGGGASRQPSGPAQDMSGTVKWYDPAKGFGFVSVSDGGKDVFVHRSVLARAGISMLDEGQQVMIGVVDGQKGREAATISVGD